MRARRFWAALGSLALVVGVAAPSTAVTSPSPRPTCDGGVGRLDHGRLRRHQAARCRSPTYSWSTGYSTSVKSLNQRSRHRQGRCQRSTSRSLGAKMATLNGQALSANLAVGTDLVTILMGANDACTSTESDMTRPGSLPNAVPDGARNARERQAGRPDRGRLDPGRLQAVVRSTGAPRRRGSSGGSTGSASRCWPTPTSSKAPTCSAGGGVRERVARVQQGAAERSAIWSVACKFDERPGRTASSSPPADISKVDYFHPSVRDRPPGDDQPAFEQPA